MPEPVSEFFEVLQTEHAGRGVFATQDISAGTLLLTSNDLVMSFLHRDYLREVCVWCFAYDNGRYWNVRESGASLTWCSEECKREWLEANGGNVALLCYEAVEIVLKGRTQNQLRLQTRDGQQLVDNQRPPIEDIEALWEAAEKIGIIITEMRGTTTPIKRSKVQSRVLANLGPPSAGAITYLLAATISRYVADDSMWQDLLDLYPSSAPYASLTVLQEHITAYHHLLSILPIPLLPYVTPTILRTVINRDAHNSFGILSLDDEGSEMFGHAIYPSASYWNHSCDPCVDKRRIRRMWEFRASRDVKKGEELCITYLGGDEKTMSVKERRTRLWNAWKFRCACERCIAEEGE